jgi:hypothetical protein
VHFAQGGWSIWKKLQPLLTEDQVKRGVCEGHGHGVALMPYD